MLYELDTVLKYDILWNSLIMDNKIFGIIHLQKNNFSFNFETYFKLDILWKLFNSFNQTFG